MSQTIPIVTSKKEQFIDISALIQKECLAHGPDRGICHIFVPHTTAAVTINENADPDVVDDILSGLSRMVPERGFKHAEGNSPAHIRSSLLAVSLSIPVSDKRLQLGTWQGIYFCEFDGPRHRKIWLNFYGA